ncbi:uncharacterized protein PG998_007411 [Apiospora kogelbergensis]|uniref:Mso1 N-terminal domain-containing protein n=1 Tax=Apiospora kogelbergensis TaxID=1337665 RepID=A0AAW0QF60_9PEZI
MSWYSNILTTTTSRINNLQRTFLGGETDGDTEDDTHVCRILRGYYTEKGRPFPGWLPPDPKAPPPVQPVAAQPGQVGSRYGGLTQQQGSGSLSSLWDNNPVSQPQDPQSLRRGRGAPPPARQADPRLNPFGRNSGDGGGREEIQARPLPSQRAGSYQQSGPARDAPSSGGGGGGSAQDRLRQRLWGGSRTASPAGSGPFQPPQAQQQSSHRGGGGGSADYEDRFAPGGMYDGGSGGRSSGGDRPFVGSNSPWASGEQDMGGGGGGGRPGGLPSGPRRGLPSGPRMR